MQKNTFLPIFLLASAAFAQDSPEQIIEKVTPSVATVLSGRGSGNLAGMASAVVIRENGLLLTAHHALKNAGEIQVRFKNGETFDEVQLLGVDQRRDVAAIRIAAKNLPAIQVKPMSEIRVGASIYVVSLAATLPWTASSGMISAIRIADEVPGAGSGYRAAACLSIPTLD
jgi:S1-C subfamily serine protease